MEDQEKVALEKANEELRRTRDEIDRLSRFKTHLLSLTSHQLKTPMGIIRGYATLLREGFYGELNEQIKEILSKIEFSTEEVVSLVDNIIDLRKVEEGRLQYQMDHVDFVKLARQAAQEMGHMAMSRGLNLSFSGPEHQVMIYGDEQKLRHVIQNLIDNAIKYTSRGFVAVNVMALEEKVILSVADSGIGISSELIPNLFQEFVREPGPDSEIRGTGIGLFIAKIFTEAHNGKIWVESIGLGQGSTFYVSIPRK
jgi:signal transduction histidine kinase